jgi:hypothetical protein
VQVRPSNTGCREKLQNACRGKELKGLVCKKCVDRATKEQFVVRGLKKEELVGPDTCNTQQLHDFCFYEEIVVQGDDASNSCQLELQQGPCNVYAKSHEIPRCLSCISDNKEKIKKSMVGSSKCEASHEYSFCGVLKVVQGELTAPSVVV